MSKARERARKMLDKAILITTDGFFGLDDMPDTPMVMNATDEIESALSQSHKLASKLAMRWAREITEDEGYLLFD